MNFIEALEKMKEGYSVDEEYGHFSLSFLDNTLLIRKGRYWTLCESSFNNLNICKYELGDKIR